MSGENNNYLTTIATLGVIISAILITYFLTVYVNRKENIDVILGHRRIRPLSAVSCGDVFPRFPLVLFSRAFHELAAGYIFPLILIYRE